MINDQMVEWHEYAFLSDYSHRQINPESVRKLFISFDESITSHGLRNLFKSWADNNDVSKFQADRCVDHSLDKLDKASMRYNTLEARYDIAKRYFAFIVTGTTTALRQQPHLKVAA